MRLLIIPDIHLKWHIADEILKKERGKYDKVIWHNDLFDDFQDDAASNQKAAYWLKEQLEDDNNIFLLSNHTASYTWPNSPLSRCSGFSKDKCEAIYRVITQDELKKQKSYYICDDFLFSHAGLSLLYLNYEGLDDNKKALTESLQILDEEARHSSENNKEHSFFGAGISRWGSFAIGGLLWNDFHDEMIPIQSFKQVIGHTPLEDPTFSFSKPFEGKNDNKSIRDRYFLNIAKDLSGIQFPTDPWVLGLDTHLSHYSILDTALKKIEIYKIIKVYPKNFDRYQDFQDSVLTKVIYYASA
jgi:hypothetical protein